MVSDPPVGGAMAMAVLEALTVGPLSRADLAHRLEVRSAVLATCIAALASEGRVTSAGGLVGLPGQLSEPTSASEIPPEQKAILAALKAHGPATADELARSSGQGLGAVRCRIRSLSVRKLIRINADGVASLPGQTAAQSAAGRGPRV